MLRKPYRILGPWTVALTTVCAGCSGGGADHVARTSDTDANAAAAWQTVQELNRAWTSEGHPELLREYFHPRMVVIDPVKRERTEGGAAAVADWTAFTEAARIRWFRERDPKVEVYGGGRFAVVTYYYEMAYDMGGRAIETSGRDLMALVKEGDRWWVVADHFSPDPGGAP